MLARKINQILRKSMKKIRKLQFQKKVKIGDLVTVILIDQMTWEL